MTVGKGMADRAHDGPSIFLSYARADAKRARPVIAALEQAGIKVWWDGLLGAGEVYLPTTEAALESADAVVVLWSATSVESNWVRDEATRGRERQCLVPLSLDGSQAPLGFRQFQVIDIRKWRGKADAPELQAVVRAIQALSDRPAVPRPAARKGLSRRATLIGGGVAVAGLAGLVGWRLIKPVAGGAAENAIAVIPFANLGAAGDAYFSAGLSEELRATLARNQMLRIAAPTSAGEFRDAVTDVQTIARKLGVAHILRGSVRHGTDRVRVTVELLDGKDARLAWTQTLERKLADVLAMQVEIASIVARALFAEISAQAIARGRSGDLQQIGGTANADAFDAYLRGKALVEVSEDEASDRAALAKFDTAISRDPGYASALAARSKILAVIANETGKSSEVPQLYDRAVASGQAAVKAAPQLAEAHSALGYAIYNGRLDPRGARASYDRSRELGGGDADVLRTFALYCAYTGRAAEAAEAIEMALTLDPLNPGAFRAAGYIAFARRDFPATLVQMRKALELNPKLSAANSAIGSALYLAGQSGEAASAFAAEPLALFRLQGEAILKRKAGDTAGAQQALDQLTRDFGSNSNYQQAQVLAQWGDAAGALDRLGKAAAARDAGLLLAATDPMLDPLRQAPEFAQLLSRLGLA